jgi:hypothetical protein
MSQCAQYKLRKIKGLKKRKEKPPVLFPEKILEFCKQFASYDYFNKL